MHPTLAVPLQRSFARRTRVGAHTRVTVVRESSEMTTTTLHPSDEQLLSAVATGDRSAVATLYDRHAGLVYGLARRVVRDPGLCEEVVQDTFVKVWRRAETFDASRAGAVTWLVGVARNCAIDRLRREAAQPLHGSVEILDGDGASTVDDGASSADDEYAADPADIAQVHDRADRIRVAVKQLPPAQRRAIELAYFSGLSQSEIATRLDEPLGTIKTRIYHGMRTLRGLLDAAGVRDE